MQIAVYARKSRLSEKGESIQNQIRLCKKYALSTYPEAEFTVFEDEGYSGKNTERPAFHKMLSDLKKQTYQAVVCYQLDRISRSVTDFSSILEVLSQNQVAFLSVKERFDTSSPMGRAMLYISSVFAQLERETIAERIRDNMRQLAYTGRWLGGTPPTGFTPKKIEYTDIHGSHKKLCCLSPKEEELSVIKTIFQLYLTLESQSGVAKYLQNHEILTKNKKYFCTKAIKTILQNPVYVSADTSIYQYYAGLGCIMANEAASYQGNGLFLINRYDESLKNKITQRPASEWIVALASHKGLISASDFLHVQHLLLKNEKKAVRTGTSSYALFSEKLLCPQCGSKMTVIRKGNSSLYYYKCLVKKQSKGSLCQMKNLNGPAFDNAVLTELDKYASTNQHKLLQAMLLKLSENSENRSTQKTISNYQDKIDKLTEILEQNSTSSAAKHILTKIEAYDKKIADLQNKRLFPSLPSLEQTIQNYCTSISILPFALQKQYIQKIIEKIEIEKNTIQITVKKFL